MKILKFNESIDIRLDTINDCLTPISDDFKTTVVKVDDSMYEIVIDKSMDQKLESIDDIDNFLLKRSQESEIILRCKEFISRINAESFSLEVLEIKIIIRLEFAEKLDRSTKFMVKDEYTLRVYEKRLKKIILDNFGVNLNHIENEYDEYEEENRILFVFDDFGDSPLITKSNITKFIYESNKNILENREGDDDTYHPLIIYFRVIANIINTEIIN